ncbi:CU044_2847 family protein [Streptomyces sp. DH24]|uniref:CU044_2847 family protein n=1 Tax=Streptomyces sp. DH24 TaxID=3040123 RepID=UPI002441D1F4|nr:CU044_2847 family protein [Streptomyces sp. DH24]MDG9717092.1 CU044_2847 family protein [Streptomyces sp. DH24]
MDGLVEFKTEDGAVVVVEAADGDAGARLVARGDGPVQATRTFERALDGVRAAAESALRVFRDGTLRPDGVEIEFGVKMATEAGAVIAKGTAEGHLVVRLSWTPGQQQADRTPGQQQADRSAGQQQADAAAVPGQRGAVPDLPGQARQAQPGPVADTAPPAPSARPEPGPETAGHS